MIETIVTAPIPGGARSFSQVWPYNKPWNVGTTHPTQLMARQSPLAQGPWQSQVGGAPPGPFGFQVYNGRVAVLLTAGGGTSWVEATAAGLGFHTNTTKGGARVQGDFACWRIVLIAAAVGNISTIGDLGLSLNFFSTFGSLGSNGMLLRPTSATDARFTSVVGGVNTADDFMVRTLDTSEYNAYELRLNSATDTQEGVVKVFVNGIKRGTYAWGAGSVLPSGGVWQISVCNRGSDKLYVPIAGLSISAGPTEQACI